jgi:hypothetical protein
MRGVWSPKGAANPALAAMAIAKGIKSLPSERAVLQGIRAARTLAPPPISAPRGSPPAHSPRHPPRLPPPERGGPRADTHRRRPRRLDPGERAASPSTTIPRRSPARPRPSRTASSGGDPGGLERVAKPAGQSGRHVFSGRGYDAAAPFGARLPSRFAILAASALSFATSVAMPLRTVTRSRSKRPAISWGEIFA